jgi:PAS domain-containing protein
MAHRALDARQHIQLRLRAARRLNGADAKQDSMMARATGSLAVLHAMASSPARAEDALAMLHELQVHQVELDLQAEELRDARAELEVALRRQVELYDRLPVGCLTIDRQFVILEVNQAGARMLGVDHPVTRGLSLDTVVSAASLGALQGLVSGMGASGHARGTLPWRSLQGADQQVRAELGHDPAGQGYVVVLMTLD